ncbi:MAG: hypothetical protein GX883_07200 [Firmicutes bacterium]|nr:hypothetical protein [Bacillota bacterium]
MSGNLEELLLNLLEPGVYKTTGQLVQEFRMEYPEQWQELEREGKQLFGGTCGAYQQPSTRLAQVLFSLPEERCLCRRRGGEYRWSARR